MTLEIKIGEPLVSADGSTLIGRFQENITSPNENADIFSWVIELPMEIQPECRPLVCGEMERISVRLRDKTGAGSVWQLLDDPKDMDAFYRSIATSRYLDSSADGPKDYSKIAKAMGVILENVRLWPHLEADLRILKEQLEEAAEFQRQEL